MIPVSVYITICLGMAFCCWLSYKVGYGKGWTERSRNLGVNNLPRFENPPPPPPLSNESIDEDFIYLQTMQKKFDDMLTERRERLARHGIHTDL